jgi:hypothetical protein
MAMILIPPCSPLADIRQILKYSNMHSYKILTVLALAASTFTSVLSAPLAAQQPASVSNQPTWAPVPRPRIIEYETERDVATSSVVLGKTTREDVLLASVLRQPWTAGQPFPSGQSPNSRPSVQGEGYLKSPKPDYDPRIEQKVKSTC